MAIDTSSSSFDNTDDVGFETEERERKGRVRVKSHPHQRIRSYQQLLEDFQEESYATQPLDPGLATKVSQNQFRNTAGMDDPFEMDENENAEKRGAEQDHVDVFSTPTQPIVSSPVSSPRKQQRREDTARRSKRFSLPAVGLHTTVVTARTSAEVDEVPITGGVGVGEEGVVGERVGGGLSKRFSLVLAGRNSHHIDGTGQEENGDLGLAKGLAAARLSELLGRKLIGY